MQVIVGRIWLQGERTLEVIGVEAESVRYRVLGLDEVVEIRDRRPAGRWALEAARTPEGYEAFPANFDSCALVEMREEEQGVVVELRDPDDGCTVTHDVLWIVAHINDSLPTWPMAWHVESELQDDGHSFVAVLE